MIPTVQAQALEKLLKLLDEQRLLIEKARYSCELMEREFREALESNSIGK